MKILFTLFGLTLHLIANAQNDPELFPINDRSVGYLGYYLEDGKTNIVKPQFCTATYNIDGYYIVSKAEHEFNEYGARKEEHILNTEKFALLDSKGQFVIDFFDNYDFIRISNGLIEVGKKNFYGIVNKNKEIQLPLEYEELEIKNQEIIIAKKNNNFGVVTKDNKTIIPFIYDELYSFTEIKSTNNFYLIVLKDGKNGIIDKNNKFIIELGQHDIQFITENSICIKKDEKFNLFSYNLNAIFPNDFKSMRLVGVYGNGQEIYAEDKNNSYYFALDGALLKKEKLAANDKKK